MSDDTAVIDLPAGAYPAVVELWLRSDSYDAEPRWRETVTGPGVLTVPCLGGPTRLRITAGDWQVYEA